MFYHRIVASNSSWHRKQQLGGEILYSIVIKTQWPIHVCSNNLLSNNNLEAMKMKERKEGLHFILNFSVSLPVLLTM